ncbi:HAD family hydrolase [Methylicorpusculum sp.]|uniref:HAD family hydrolase n=1 Tax=Methylicorpusculum sp. TaxID=2713644 RepID=UPI002731E694|nr:HAD family phosphatase [Methylicorpusculum sp.]MDP2177052.1 HAD family phosphatase [Methylicorpusculum sp.]MDP3529914.1 HAD family phosphatase [Methylicorpusculum sp.]MDZ4153297.1 HAD family phosphatase [Methylicorpusculum sp.]
MKVVLPDVDAVIFDMDGLVLDTETTYFIAWQQAAAQMGYVLPDAFCESLSGLHFQQVSDMILAYCGHAFSLDHFNQMSGKIWRDYVSHHGIPVKNGFFNLLDVITQFNLPFCLATNSLRANALECLDLAGLNAIFTTLVTREMCVNPKPAPDLFIKASELLTVPIGRCLILEDSFSGVMAAVQAGGITGYVPSQVAPDKRAEFLADFKATDLEDVSRMLAYKVTTRPL